jgi:hypothetical protein
LEALKDRTNLCTNPIYSIYVGKPERKTPVWRPKSRWEDNIKMNLNGMELRVWAGFI